MIDDLKHFKAPKDPWFLLSLIAAAGCAYLLFVLWAVVCTVLGWV